MRKIIVALLFLIFPVLTHAQLPVKEMFKSDSIFIIKYNDEFDYYDSLTFTPHTVKYEGYTVSAIMTADQEWYFPLRFTLTLPVKGVEYFVKDYLPRWFLYDHSQYIIILYGNDPSLQSDPREQCRDLDDDEVDYYFDLMDFDFKDWRTEYDGYDPKDKIRNIWVFYWHKHSYSWPLKKKNRRNFIFNEGGFSILGLNILPQNEALFKAYVNNTFAIQSDFVNDVLWNSRLTYEKDLREGKITAYLPRYGGKIPYVVFRSILLWKKNMRKNKKDKQTDRK